MGFYRSALVNLLVTSVLVSGLLCQNPRAVANQIGGAVAPGSYVLRLDTGALIPITGRIVAWPRDSSHFAVVEGKGDAATLRLYDTSIGSSVALPFSVNDSIRMNWSPDGSRLVYWAGCRAGIADSTGDRYIELGGPC